MANEGKQSQEIRKVSPSHPVTPFEEMDRLFDTFLRRSWLSPMRFGWPATEMALPFDGHAPKVDVIDRENEVVVRAEVPGVEKADLDISVGEATVTIKGATHREQKEEQGDYYRHELTEGSFSRTVGLPTTVDGPNAKANFKDGVLELVLPKIEKAKRYSVKVE